MRFYPVPEGKIDKIIPLITKAHEEIESPKLATLERSKKMLADGYAQRTLAAYVDDISEPKHLVVLSAVPSITIEGIMVIVHLVYSDPEARGGREAVTGMHKTIEGYAAAKGAGQILGTSWVYRGSPAIDGMWTSFGYEKQSINYVKEL